MGLKDFVPFLRRGYCPHRGMEPGPAWCGQCQQEMADLIEKILKLWTQRRLLEEVDPLELE